MVEIISRDHAVFCEVDDAGPWLRAEIPSSVHNDLLRFGQISDLFVEDNELHLQWVAERAWAY